MLTLKAYSFLDIFSYTMLMQMTLPFLRNEKSVSEVIKTSTNFLFFLGSKSVMQNVKLLALVSKRGLR